MIECRHCRTVLRGEAARREARCPSCRMPLYEKPESQRRPPPNVAGLGACLVHPHNDAIGRCRRCQQLFCSICRTRWQDDLLCLACLNQALETQETAPREIKTQRRQGLTSLVMAILGWCMFLGSGAILWSMGEGRGSKDVAILTLVLFLSCFVPTLVSLGQASATIRSRGQRMALATWSLALAALQLGVTLGLVLLNITHN